MKALRFAARSGGLAPLPYAAATAFSAGALIAALAGTACGGDDDDNASKGFIGTTYPDPPRLGPREPEPDAGSPSAQVAPSSAAR